MAVPETTESEKKSTGIVEFLQGTKVELKKVTWPTKQELIAHTVVVLIAVVLCSTMIWVFDTIFSGFFRLLLQ